MDRHSFKQKEIWFSVIFAGHNPTHILQSGNTVVGGMYSVFAYICFCSLITSGTTSVQCPFPAFLKLFFFFKHNRKSQSEIIEVNNHF